MDFNVDIIRNPNTLYKKNTIIKIYLTVRHTFFLLCFCCLLGRTAARVTTVGTVLVYSVTLTYVYSFLLILRNTV